MANSDDNGDNRESSEHEDVDLRGRLRNPGPNTTEIESHEEQQQDEAVEDLAARLRQKKEQNEEDASGPSLDEQEGSDAVQSEDLEDSLLDALQTEDGAETGTSSKEATDTDSGTGKRPTSDAGPQVGAEASGSTASAPSSEEAAPSGGSTPQGRKQNRSPEPHDETLRPGDGDSDAERAGQVCPDCNSISPPGMRFCVECGASLRSENDQEDRAAKSSPELDRDVLDSEVPAGFKLVSINDDGTDGKAIPLKSPETIVGREGDTRFPTDEFLNPKHARLTVEGGALFVEDLHSLNGTYLKLRDEVRLNPGDTFLMGRQVLRFERIEQDLDSKKTAADGTRYMGSPAPGGDFKILQIGVGNLVQNIYCLPESGVVLGREKGDIIFPRDKFMSGRHARIFTDGAPHLVDLNSSNGTWIKLWEKTELEKDDYIFMGQQLFRVELPE